MSSEESYKLDFLIDGLKSFGGFASPEKSGRESFRWGILGGAVHTMWWVEYILNVIVVAERGGGSKGGWRRSFEFLVLSFELVDWLRLMPEATMRISESICGRGRIFLD